MNILANLIPGAREIRTPLIVGYLWIAILWINYPLLPHEFRNSVIANRIQGAGQHLNLAAIIIALSIAAFFVGVIFELIGQAIRFLSIVVAMFWLVASVPGLATLILLAIIGLFLRIGFLWAIPTCLVLAVLTYLALRNKRMRQKVAQSALNRTITLRDVAAELWSVLARVVLPTRQTEREFVAERIEKTVAAHPTILTDLCRTLNIYTLRYAYEGMAHHPDQSSPSDIDPKSISKAKRTYWIDPSSTSILRAHFRECMDASAKARKQAYLRAIETSEITDQTRNAFATATVLLQNSDASIYNQYERLQSEGELRIDAAVPIGAIVASLLFSFSIDLSWLLPTSVTPTFLLLLSGIRKKEEAATSIYRLIESDAELTGIHAHVMSPELPLTWNRAGRKPVQKIRAMTKARNALHRITRQREPDTGELGRDLGKHS